MKIYFGFTVAGDRSGIEAARCIVHLLENLGHQRKRVGPWPDLGNALSSSNDENNLRPP
jgi:hypothetical protein